MHCAQITSEQERIDMEWREERKVKKMQHLELCQRYELDKKMEPVSECV